MPEAVTCLPCQAYDPLTTSARPRRRSSVDYGHRQRLVLPCARARNLQRGYDLVACKWLLANRHAGIVFRDYSRVACGNEDERHILGNEDISQPAVFNFAKTNVEHCCIDPFVLEQSNALLECARRTNHIRPRRFNYFSELKSNQCLVLDYQHVTFCQIEFHGSQIQMAYCEAKLRALQPLSLTAVRKR